MNRTMPELFKIRGTKPYEHHATINFANAEVLRAVETIVGEMCAVFRSSPYFHIGGDEADFIFAHQHPEFQAAFRSFELGEKGQWQLYRHFLIQMNQIVRKQGKQMIVWEGFHREPDSKFQIPKDVIVMEYECPFYPPRQLVEDGRTVINACWTPLYVVNQKRWSPQQIYDWNLYRFGQHTTQYALTTWHQLEATEQIIGGQMLHLGAASGDRDRIVAHPATGHERADLESGRRPILCRLCATARRLRTDCSAD